MKKVYEVKKDQKNVFEGSSIELREWIEEQLLRSSLGFSPMLQENEDEEEFELYLHSEWNEDLEEKEIDEVINLGFNEADSLPVIQKLLGISIECQI